MREKHPIDERFRQALYHREADPPEAVRAALAIHLGRATTPRIGGTWWPMMIVAVGLVGTGAALWAWENDPGEAAIAIVEPLAQQRRSEQSGSANNATSGGPSTANTSATPAFSAAHSTASTNSAMVGQQKVAPENASVGSGSTSSAARTANVTEATANGVNKAGTHSAENVPEANTERGRSNTGGSAGRKSNAVDPPVLKDGEDAGTAFATGSMATDQVDTPNVPEPFVRVAGSEFAASALDLRSTLMDPLRTAPDAVVANGAPIARALPPNYVLPSGTWWIGPYAGIGTVQGTWKGVDADALQEAEQWRSTTQGGLLVGREWRSGWGVSAGVGVARVRSTFHHDDATQASSVLEVDTTWVTTMHTSGGILYSWQIDSLTEEIPGRSVRKDARNLYTAVQVPLLLHWHAEARRMRYGAFGGMTAWIPTQRKGLTLVRSPQDAPPTILALQDPKVNDRFSTQVHGLIGLSVGYTITEHLSAHAEPMISAPLISFDGVNTPWLTRPLLQFRIQYELRSKGR